MKKNFKNKKKKACLPKRRGFTLMELMIVIAIIGIMTGVGLVSINESRKIKEVESEARKVAAVIREAQNNALSGKNADVCHIGWRFSYAFPDSQNFSIRGLKKNCNAVVRYTLNKDIFFSVAPSSIKFTFPNGFNTSGNKTITLCKPGNICYSVCINDVGKIEEVKGNVCP